MAGADASKAAARPADDTRFILATIVVVVAIALAAFSLLRSEEASAAAGLAPGNLGSPPSNSAADERCPDACMYPCASGYDYSSHRLELSGDSADTLVTCIVQCVKPDGVCCAGAMAYGRCARWCPETVNVTRSYRVQKAVPANGTWVDRRPPDAGRGRIDTFCTTNVKWRGCTFTCELPPAEPPNVSDPPRTSLSPGGAADRACPYSCQSWDDAAGDCVGPESNDC